MQVLVVLAQAGGVVVSRHALIERCWDGRIVGENAINRVISLVRALGADIGANAFELETITKVGYRMIVKGAPAPAWAASPSATKDRRARRRVVLAGGAIAMIGAAGLGWYSLRRRPPSRAARELYDKALLAQRQGLPEQTSQSVGFLREAVRIDPEFAGAWGALALSYRHQLEGASGADQATVAGWITAAADRALSLDPDNADAQVARILIKPHYRNWTSADAAYREMLKRYPDHWLLRGTFGRLMQEVGRWREAIPPFRANVAADPFLPVSRYFLAQGLWNSGQWQEAETIIEGAFTRWPTHPMIWLQRFDFLANTGRPAAAIAFASNAPDRPLGPPEAFFTNLIAMAQALESGATADIEKAVALALTSARSGPDSIPRAVQTLALMGRLDPAFGLLDSYFLQKASADTRAAEIGPLTRRITNFLFSQSTARLRDDPRFAVLTEAIGLEAYWRATRSAPDYRRAGAQGPAPRS